MGIHLPCTCSPLYGRLCMLAFGSHWLLCLTFSLPIIVQAKGPSPFTFTLAEPAVLRAISVNKVGLASPIRSEDYVVENGVLGGIAGVGLLIEQELGSSEVAVTKVTPGGAADREGRQVLKRSGALVPVQHVDECTGF